VDHQIVDGGVPRQPFAHDELEHACVEEGERGGAGEGGGEGLQRAGVGEVEAGVGEEGGGGAGGEGWRGKGGGLEGGGGCRVQEGGEDEEEGEEKVGRLGGAE